MLAELRTKSQITLPKEIVSALGLSEGDKLEVYERDGMICMIPVAVYPKNYVDDLQGEIRALKEKIKTGQTPTFESIDEMMKKLEENEC